MKFILNKEGNHNIHLDPWDTWNLDHTLSLIIVPALKQLKNTTHGAPRVSNKDVPKCLRAPKGQSDFDSVDENYFKRWDYVLDEMIYAFEQVQDDCCTNLAEETEWKRVNNGLRLFGKYYTGLWD
jgi:hypothetical protein